MSGMLLHKNKIITRVNTTKQLPNGKTHNPSNLSHVFKVLVYTPDDARPAMCNVCTHEKCQLSSGRGRTSTGSPRS